MNKNYGDKKVNEVITDCKKAKSKVKKIKFNTNDIFNKVEKLIKNRELASYYGENGRKHMIKNFAQNIIWEEINRKVYK